MNEHKKPKSFYQINHPLLIALSLSTRWVFNGRVFPCWALFISVKTFLLKFTLRIAHCIWGGGGRSSVFKWQCSFPILKFDQNCLEDVNTSWSDLQCLSVSRIQYHHHPQILLIRITAMISIPQRLDKSSFAQIFMWKKNWTKNRHLNSFFSTFWCIFWSFQRVLIQIFEFMHHVEVRN